jgi:hypothetical protein
MGREVSGLPDYSNSFCSLNNLPLGAGFSVAFGRNVAVSFFTSKLVKLPFNIDSNYQVLKIITGLSGISVSKRRPIIT